MVDEVRVLAWDEIFLNPDATLLVRVCDVVYHDEAFAPHVGVSIAGIGQMNGVGQLLALGKCARTITLQLARSDLKQQHSQETYRIFRFAKDEVNADPEAIDVADGGTVDEAVVGVGDPEARGEVVEELQAQSRLAWAAARI